MAGLAAEGVGTTKGRSNRVAEAVGVVLSLFPLLVLVGLYAYVVRARLHVGYWPAPYRPQSYRLGFEWHFNLLRPWFHFVFPFELLPLIAGAYTAVQRATTGRVPRRQIAILLASSAIAYACAIVDPGGFIVWFRD